MRIRTIKPEFFKHDALAALDPLCRLLFIGLWCMADCEGRLEARTKRIKAEVLPYDDCDIEPMLAKLEAGEYLQRYEVAGVKVIQITNFARHQRLSGKEANAESIFPEPPGKHPGSDGEAVGNAIKERKGKEGEEKGNEWWPAEFLNSPPLKAKWREFERYSSEKSNTITPSGRRAQLGALSRFPIPEALAYIERAMEGNWRGLNLDKPLSPGANGNSAKPPAVPENTQWL